MPSSRSRRHLTRNLASLGNDTGISHWHRQHCHEHPLRGRRIWRLPPAARLALHRRRHERGLDGNGNPNNANTDDDAHDDGEEAIAGTDPTDSNSFFRVTVVESPATNTVVLRWPSVASRIYHVRLSTNLLAGFTSIATNEPASPPTNVYTDVSVTDSNRFYEVRVELGE